MVTERPQRAMSRDWANQTNAILVDAKASKGVSCKLRGEAAAVRRTMDRQTKEQQATVEEALRRKVLDTTCLKNKIERRLVALQCEADKLSGMRDKAAAAAVALQKPINKTEARLLLREKRPQREKICDKVERSLEAELEELRKARTALESLVKGAELHLAAMSTCRQTLKADLSDKSQSLKLDIACLDLPAKATNKNGSSPLLSSASSSSGREGMPTVRSTTLPSLWKQNTEKVLNDASRLEHESHELRRKISGAVHEVSEARDKVHDQVQEALGSKVKQTSTLQSRLNQNLLEVNAELESLEEQRQQVVRALQAKEVPLAIVKDRLHLRQTRPAREVVRDNVEEALEEEHAKLSQAIKTLQRKLRSLDHEREKLLATQRHIGQDIKGKTASLNIDKRCLDLDQASSSTPLSAFSVHSSNTSRRMHRIHRAEDFKRTKRASPLDPTLTPRPPALGCVETRSRKSC